MKVLGLLTGMVQAYIFSILATVYIAAAVKEGRIKDKTKSITNNLKEVKNG
jgi:F-type H+-transporting ATPase subunit a